jgi:hypothetical protein
MSPLADKKALLDSALIYEGILQKIPNDLYSIEELINIYQIIGDTPKLTLYKKRLELIQNGETLLPLKVEVQKGSVQQVITVNKTKQVANRKVNLKARPSVREPVAPGWRRKTQELDHIIQTKALADLVFKMQYSMKSQVDLLLTLSTAEIISKDELAEIMYRLASHQFLRDPQKPQMVMHMLEACEGVKLLKVYDFLSKVAELAYIDLSVEPLNQKLYEVLPSTLVYNHGIVIFKEIDNEYCVAVLNPLNTELMEHTLNLLDKRANFFLTSASDFDLFLKKHAQSH